MSEARRLAARVLDVEDFHGIIANPVECQNIIEITEGCFGVDYLHA